MALKKAGKNPRCFSAGSLTQWLKRLFLVFRFLFLVTDPSYQEHLHLQSSSVVPTSLPTPPPLLPCFLSYYLLYSAFSSLFRCTHSFACKKATWLAPPARIIPIFDCPLSRSLSLEKTSFILSLLLEVSLSNYRSVHEMRCKCYWLLIVCSLPTNSAHVTFPISIIPTLFAPSARISSPMSGILDDVFGGSDVGADADTIDDSDTMADRERTSTTTSITSSSTRVATSTLSSSARTTSTTSSATQNRATPVTSSGC